MGVRAEQGAKTKCRVETKTIWGGKKERLMNISWTKVDREVLKRGKKNIRPGGKLPDYSCNEKKKKKTKKGGGSNKLQGRQTLENCLSTFG